MRVQRRREEIIKELNELQVGVGGGDSVIKEVN